MAYKPKILLFDIENTPSRGRFFGKLYETNILDVDEYSYVLCYAYSWYPDKKVHVVALPDFKGYKKGNDCEEKLIESMWKLLDEADIVVGQNSDSFDIKHLNARFAYYRMPPPSPYQKVDTLKQLRRAFNLPSNKLDEVCKYFNIGSKLPHTGKHLWLGCMSGNLDDWKLMKKYNANDVVLLHDLYRLLLPWGKQPNLNVLSGREDCPACGLGPVIKKGYDASYGRIYQRMKCLNCGANSKHWGEPREVKVKIRPV